MKLLSTIILIVAFCATSFSQVTISGRVTDSTTGLGISNATATYSSCLFPQDGPSCSVWSTRAGYSNPFGYFTVPDVWWACSVNVLTVSKKNYEPQAFVTSNCGDVYIEVALVPSN